MCETIMEAVSLTKHFRSADKTWFTAVDGASISLQKGKTLGLLGQSGSGKSTLGQMMVGLLRPDSGELFFHGKLLSYPIRGQARRRIQILFQHPEVSFNPQLTLRQSLVEPFKLMGKPFDDGAISPLSSRSAYTPSILPAIPANFPAANCSVLRWHVSPCLSRR